METLGEVGLSVASDVLQVSRVVEGLACLEQPLAKCDIQAKANLMQIRQSEKPLRGTMQCRVCVAKG